MTAFIKPRNCFDLLNALVAAHVVPDVAHRILIWGKEPGTGKSTWCGTQFSPVERITLFSQQAPEDLIGQTGLETQSGGTRTVWQDGPAVRAMRQGIPLVLDEVDQHSPDMRCALHAVLDDWAQAGVTLPNGERVKPVDGYMVVGTTNASPDSLADALLSRFDLVVLADKPAPGVIAELGALGPAVARRYDRTTEARWTAPLGVRSALAVKRMAEVIGLESAAELVFGDNAADILASVAVQSV